MNADRLTSLGYRAGWALVRVLPERAAYGLFQVIADAVWRRRGKGVLRLEANLARVVPTASRDELAVLSQAGLRSYLRYWCDAFRLAGWSPERVLRTTRTESMDAIREVLASGRGVVAALSHQGNWDHAGAWSNQHLAPVTTVAERLKPEDLYERFVAYRTALGIRILPLTGGDGDVFGTLTKVLADGGFVPLLADRDLTARGVPVSFFGAQARMAAGPAALALDSGAALFAISVRYERLAPGPAGWGIVITGSPELVAPASGTREEKVAALTQRCADHLAAGIATAPQDWHMLQKVFTADLDPRVGR